MNVTLVKALIALVPGSMMLVGSVILFLRCKKVSAFLQVVGGAGLIGVVLTHIGEALRLFPWMRWGLEQSAGHYIDLGSAVLGLTLFPAGYLSWALRQR
jgi:hypothetical protein